MRTRILLSLFAVLLGLFAPAAAAHGKAADEQPEELRDILEPRGMEVKQTHKRSGSIRDKVLGDTAKTIAFQRGFAYRYEKIMAAVNARSHDLDSIFNFAPLLINGRVLPPVIRWVNQAFNIESDVYATTVDAQYRIVASARIVATPPSWRDYLAMETGSMQASPSIFPRTSDEKTLWRAFVAKGWEEGMAHADEVFGMNMNRLVSDYRGILRFKMLADRGLVSVPVLAEGHLGIQVGDQVLNMDQKTFRITVPAAFQAGGRRE